MTIVTGDMVVGPKTCAALATEVAAHTVMRAKRVAVVASTSVVASVDTYPVTRVAMVVGLSSSFLVYLDNPF